MRVRRWLLAPVALLFFAVSAWAMWEHGYLALWKLPFTDSGTLQLFVDLGTALLLVSVWMIRDARNRGISVAPFLLITLVGGSAGPLLYLFRLEFLPASHSP